MLPNCPETNIKPPGAGDREYTIFYGIRSLMGLDLFPCCQDQSLMGFRASGWLLGPWLLRHVDFYVYGVGLCLCSSLCLCLCTYAMPLSCAPTWQPPVPTRPTRLLPGSYQNRLFFQGNKNGGKLGISLNFFLSQIAILYCSGKSTAHLKNCMNKRCKSKKK